MRTLTALSATLATPAFAHHEVVVATTMMPLMGGLAVIAAAAFAGLRQKLRRKQTNERS